MDPGADSKYRFGPHEIDERQVFCTTPLSFAIVNLRPTRPDVLVCPKRHVKRFADLSPEETCDLWMTAKDVGVRLEQYHRASSLTFTIQDRPHSGRTVSHVHRRKEDFGNNDGNAGVMNAKNETFDLDIERKDRTMEEMAQEADEYRALFS